MSDDGIAKPERTVLHISKEKLEAKLEQARRWLANPQEFDIWAQEWGLVWLSIANDVLGAEGVTPRDVTTMLREYSALSDRMAKVMAIKKPAEKKKPSVELRVRHHASK